MLHAKLIFCTEPKFFSEGALTANSKTDWRLWAARFAFIGAGLIAVFHWGVYAFMVAAVGTIALLFYFTPAIVAYRRAHLNREAILILNLLAGWLFVPWVIALVWAYKNDGAAHIDDLGCIPGTQQAATRTCPYCAEKIRAQAIKCRFCQSEVIPTLPG